MKRYNPKEIEPKWQKKWLDEGVFEVKQDDQKQKKYVIDMFPYPSGAAMHVGHVRNFTISDVLSQFLRQKGYNVLHTMGWDTFGLPAENYAIKTGTPPAETTKVNVANFKRQLQQMGMSYDWSREITTTDPEYYKWTQWIFTQLFKNDLAYQAERAQWWCDQCKTVLANEQVINGKCWRHDDPDDPLVTKRSLNQWFFKTTAYADKLLEGIDSLDWPEKIKTMQRNWIGKSKGAEVEFELVNNKGSIRVFTTRPDTLFGATFLVLAPEHSLVQEITTDENKQDVADYIEQTQRKSEVERQETSREKTGVFTGAYATNPVNGEKIPIWIADYVLTGYGTGAIMAVPAHDNRDNLFATQFNLPVIPVVAKEFAEISNPFREGYEVVERTAVQVIVKHPTDDSYLILKRSGWEEGSHSFVTGGLEEGESVLEAAQRELKEESGYIDIESITELPNVYYASFFHQQKKENRRVQMHTAVVKLSSLDQVERSAEEAVLNEPEWVSEQAVQEKVYGEGCKLIFKNYLENDFCYSEEGILINSGKYDNMNSAEARDEIVTDLARNSQAEEKVNYKIRDWLISRQRYWGSPIPIIHCEKDGAVAVPEEDLPVLLPEVESYQPTGNGSVLASVPEWVNTTCPKCGGPAKRETDTMDGYACSSWYYLRFTDPKNDKQAWDPRVANYWMPIDYYCGGDHAVSHLLYSRFWMYFFADQGWIEPSKKEPVGKLVYNGYILAHDGNKMSKSKGNVVNPDDLIEQGYGADSVRLFEMFIAPYDQDTRWNTNGVPGTFRFLQRFWSLVQEYLEVENIVESENPEVLKVTHGAIKHISAELEGLRFNTAVSGLMEAVNALYKIKGSDPLKVDASWRFALTAITQLLAPFAPHITEEIWTDLGNQGSVHFAQWPQWDEEQLIANSITLVVQVNGKVRANIEVAADITEEDAVRVATENEKVTPFIEGHKVKKSIYVPGKLVNIVI